jgi:release factor glutamine methyltransferase
LRRGSWWDALAGEAPFDLVISNPPYIDPAAPTGLAADVAAFEPGLALYSSRGDAASCYREILAGLPGRLVAGGHVLMETGLGAADAALAAVQGTPGMEGAELRQDLAGQPRFVVGRYAGR